MGSKAASPQRPPGPRASSTASVIQDNGHVHQQQPPNFAGSSRSSLFGLFRRRQSQSSLAPPRAASTKSVSGNDSYMGAFDNFSLGTTVTGIEAPHQTKAASGKVARMLDAAGRYRESIKQMSAASAEFGSALYDCADTKGAAAGRTSLPDHYVDSDFQAAAGLHLLISNHASVLASSMESKFDDPIRREYKENQKRVAAKEAEFRTGLRAKLQALKDAEQQNIKDSRRRTRNLLSYRSTLLDLTSQIDDINRFKLDFLSDLHAMSTELSESVHRALASAVTAEIEVFDSIARKGWSGGGLDGLLAGCPDPFEPENRSSASHSESNSVHSPRLPTDQSNLRPMSSASSDRGSVSSSNLFSVLPQNSILPSAVDSDEGGDSETLSRRNSSISDIGDLTLTPQQQPLSRRSSSSAHSQSKEQSKGQNDHAGSSANHANGLLMHPNGNDPHPGSKWQDHEKKEPEENHDRNSAQEVLKVVVGNNHERMFNDHIEENNSKGIHSKEINNDAMPVNNAQINGAVHDDEEEEEEG